MPATSGKQKRLMDAAAHNPAFAKKVGIPTKVAKEFSKESKGMTFRKGGEMNEMKMMKAKGRGDAKAMLQEHASKPASKAHKGLKAGGCATTKKYAKGGGVEIKGKTKGKMIVMKGAK